MSHDNLWLLWTPHIPLARQGYPGKARRFLQANSGRKEVHGRQVKVDGVPMLTLG